MIYRSTSPKKPALVTKRTVSLPVDLKKNTVKTKNLFWFIPRDQRNLYRNSNDNIESNKTSQKRHKVGNRIKVSPCCTECSDNVALRWASASCASSGDAPYEQGILEEQYDDIDSQLLGLRFIDSQQTELGCEGRTSEGRLRNFP